MFDKIRELMQKKIDTYKFLAGSGPERGIRALTALFHDNVNEKHYPFDVEKIISIREKQDDLGYCIEYKCIVYMREFYIRFYLRDGKLNAVLEEIK